MEIVNALLILSALAGGTAAWFVGSVIHKRLLSVAIRIALKTGYDEGYREAIETHDVLIRVGRSLRTVRAAATLPPPISDTATSQSAADWLRVVR